MRITILIISILFSVVGFGQRLPPHTTTVNIGDTETPVLMTDTTKYPNVIDDSSFYRNKQAKDKVDSMDIKVISMKEFKAYMERIDLAIKKQFDLTQVQKYEQIIKVMNSVYAEADKKRKVK